MACLLNGKRIIKCARSTDVDTWFQSVYRVKDNAFVDAAFLVAVKVKCLKKLV